MKIIQNLLKKIGYKNFPELTLGHKHYSKIKKIFHNSLTSQNCETLRKTVRKYPFLLIKNHYGLNPLEFAIREGLEDSLVTLIQEHPEVKQVLASKDLSLFHLMTEYGLEKAFFFASSILKPDGSQRNREGQPLIETALLYGRKKIFFFLLPKNPQAWPDWLAYSIKGLKRSKNPKGVKDIIATFLEHRVELSKTSIEDLSFLVHASLPGETQTKLLLDLYDLKKINPELTERLRLASSLEEPAKSSSRALRPCR